MGQTPQPKLVPGKRGGKTLDLGLNYLTIFLPGGDQEDEEEVLQLGRGDAASRDPVAQEAEPQQRGQAEGGHPRERHPLLRLRVHEGEPVPADEGPIREPRGQEV